MTESHRLTLIFGPRTGDVGKTIRGAKYHENGDYPRCALPTKNPFWLHTLDSVDTVSGCSARVLTGRPGTCSLTDGAERGTGAPLSNHPRATGWTETTTVDRTHTEAGSRTTFTGGSVGTRDSRALPGRRGKAPASQGNKNRRKGKGREDPNETPLLIGTKTGHSLSTQGRVFPS